MPKTPSTIWFKYINMYPTKSRIGEQGVLYDAQLLMLAVEKNSARVRLFHEDGTHYMSNVDISANQFWEQMKIVPT